MIRLLQLAGLCLFAACMTLSARAEDVENPPLFKASEVLGAAASGPGYRVEEKVGSDGYLRVYAVETPWGVYSVHGDGMMAVRLKEIAALDAMVRTVNSKEFGDALVKAGLKPVEFAEKLVTDPKDTVKNTVTGVGRMFNSIGAGIRNAGKTQEKTAASISGAAKQRRLIAYSYGIDPYTDWPPLKQKLDQLSRAAAAGGLAVTGAFILIPGAAGTVISNVATAETMNEMVRDLSAAQLMDMNRKALLMAGADPGLAEELLTNQHYTPTDMTALTAALTEMGKLNNVDALITRAAEAESHDAAFFMRTRLELMAAQQRKSGDITGFATLGQSPFPLAVTRANGIEAIFPLDALSWTAETSATFESLGEAARAEGMTGPVSLRITGTASPLAARKLKALGWTVEQQTGR